MVRRVDMRDETLQVRKLWLRKLLNRSSDGIIYNDHEAGAIGPRPSIRPASDAAIRSPSAPIAGRIMSDCLNDQGRRSPARLQLGAESSCWFQN
jgi:hypothetical protein